MCPGNVSLAAEKERRVPLGTVEMSRVEKKWVDLSANILGIPVGELVRRSLKSYRSLLGPDCSLDEAANWTFSEATRTLTLDRLEGYVQIAEFLTSLLNEEEFQVKVNAEQLENLIEQWKAPLPLMERVLHQLRRGRSK